MKIRSHTSLATSISVLLLSLLLRPGLVQAAGPTFTGNAAADFASKDRVVVTDPEGDVAMPRPPFPAETRSGWDMQAVYVQYDQATDTLYVGVDCLAICGDADGDGDPNSTGPILGKPVADGGLGGKDEADFGPGETFGLLIDTDNDGTYDVVVGVKDTESLANVGVFEFLGPAPDFVLDEGFWGNALANAVTVFGPLSADAPDLEFSIANISTLPNFPGEEAEALKLFMGIGSNVDDGIGEDFTEAEVPTTGLPASQMANLAQPDVMPTSLLTQLAIAPQRPFRLTIPTINLDADVEQMAQISSLNARREVQNRWQDVGYAAGWHTNSALPGEVGNVVVSGHNNIHGSIFRDLSTVEVGDTVYLWTGETRFAYVIDEVTINPHDYASAEQRAINNSYMHQTRDHRLTLISCWPEVGATDRVFVVGHLVPMASVPVTQAPIGLR